MPMQSYPSKIDAWVSVLRVILAAALAVAMSAGLLSGAHHVQLPLLVGGGAFALSFWVLADTRYILDDGQLLIRSGPFRWRISIAEITSVTPTRDPMSGPALSLDRLRISYGGGRAIMISPSEKEAFLRALDSRRHRAGLARSAR
jgi:Bacterial PH domain